MAFDHTLKGFDHCFIYKTVLVTQTQETILEDPFEDWSPPHAVSHWYKAAVPSPMLSHFTGLIPHPISFFSHDTPGTL